MAKKLLGRILKTDKKQGGGGQWETRYKRRREERVREETGLEGRWEERRFVEEHPELTGINFPILRLFLIHIYIYPNCQ